MLGVRRPSIDQLPLVALLLVACGCTPEPIAQRSALLGPDQAASEEPPAEPVAQPVEPVLAAVQAELAPAPVVEPAAPPLFVELAAGPAFTSCRAVAHIGDSTSTGMMNEFHVPDPADRLDAQYQRVGVEQPVLELFGGRSLIEHRAQYENGLMVAQRLRDAGYAGCWVIALGTNDAANVAKGSTVDRVERIERMMALIGGEPVLWVDAATKAETGYWATANMEIWNDELAATLSRHPNARIYRWSRDIRDEWYRKDGIHYNSKGNRARAKLLPDALAAAFPVI